MLGLRLQLCALSILVGVRAIPAQPQPARGAQGIPVTVALVDRLPLGNDQRFLVQRRPNVVPSDVILLRSDASATELSDAIRTLLVARQVGGDTSMRPVTLRKRRTAAQLTTPGREIPWARRLHKDLRRATAVHVEGVGQARALVIWLPASQATRQP